MAREILDVLLELRERRLAHALATVIECIGSVSAKTGAKAVIDREGRVVAGWVGGGCAESTTCQAALECIHDGEPRIIDIDMTDELLGVGMPCGGSMRIYVEPVLPRPLLWILGHGRIAECLCSMGDLVGLDVVVNDPGARSELYPTAGQLITDDIDYSQLDPKARDFIVIATQHKGDHESMERVLRTPAGYIALIASRTRAELVLDHLRERGFHERELSRIRTPAGSGLGACTPEEIALSVLAEIVMTRRCGNCLPLSGQEGPDVGGSLYAGVKGDQLG